MSQHLIEEISVLSAEKLGLEERLLTEQNEHLRNELLSRIQEIIQLIHLCRVEIDLDAELAFLRQEEVRLAAEIAEVNLYYRGDFDFHRG